MSREGSQATRGAVDGRRLRRVILGAVGALLILLGVLAAVYLHAHHTQPLPPPLWTEADLPALPAPQDNGWVLMQNGGYRFLVEHRNAVLLREGLVSGLAEGTAQEIEGELSRDEDARAEVAAPGHFVDACGLIARGCPDLFVGNLAQQRALSMVISAHRGRWSRVVEEAEVLWLQTSEFAATCRRPVACMIGVNSIEDLMLAAEAVATLALEADAPSAAALERLVALLSRPPTTSPNIGRAIVSQYVWQYDLLAASEPEHLVDLAETVRGHADLYRPVHAFAVDPTVPAPATPGPRQRDQTLWWLYNARGKAVIDLYAESLEIMTPLIVARYRDTLTNIETGRERALAALRRAITHAEAQTETNPVSQPPEPDTTDE